MLRFVAPFVAALTLAIPGSALAADSGQTGKPFTCEASALRGSALGGTAFEPAVANRGGACRDETKGGSLPAPLTAGAVSATTSLTGGDDVSKQVAFAAGGVQQLTLGALPSLGITLPTTQLASSLGAVTVPLPTQVANDLVNGLLGSTPVGGIVGGATGGAVGGSGGSSCTVNLLGVCVGGKRSAALRATPRAGLLPTSITVDLRPALQALLPGGGLPNVNLLSVQSAVAYAAGRCFGDTAAQSGSVQVSGVSVLGQTIPTDTASTQSISLLDTASVDPTKIDLSKVVLPAGITLPTATLQAILAPVLAALPKISIPSSAASVQVTPAAQSVKDGVLTQNGPRLRITLAGQSLADLTLGEAKVGIGGVDCSVAKDTPVTASDVSLQCSTRRLVLTDVVERGGKVRLKGAADLKLAGKTVSLLFHGKTVAHAKVSKSGAFTASAPLPPKRLRLTNSARYIAKLGKEKSLDLKLHRRMVVTGTKVTKTSVTIAGRVSRPLGSPVQTITLQRRVSCKKLQTVKRFKPRADGTFRVTITKPAGKGAVVYRLGTKVRKTARNPKLFPTFTLPKAVTLG